MKRAIRGNTGKNGNLNTGNIVTALLQYRNTPLKNISSSPAQLLLGKPLRDGIPQPKCAFRVSPHWDSFIRAWEKSMAKKQLHSKIYHDSHQICNHNELSVGQNVVCQNVRTKKWDITGVIIEADKFRQYKIKLHGSGRVPLRNRLHIKPLLHMKPYLPPKHDQYSVDVTRHDNNDTHHCHQHSQSEVKLNYVDQPEIEDLLNGLESGLRKLMNSISMVLVSTKTLVNDFTTYQELCVNR